MRWLRACMGLGLAAVLAGSEVTRAVIDQPEAIRLRDNAAMLRWQALFEASPSWVPRQIAFLYRRVAEEAPTLLVARLFYNGDPWGRGGRGGSSRQWRTQNVKVKRDVLRAVRASGDPVYVPFLAGMLATTAEGPLAVDLLLTLWLLRPSMAEDMALRVAWPRADDPRQPPAVRSPLVRTTALDLLIDLRGADDPALEPAMRFALLTAGGGERNHLLARLPAGAQPQLVAACILALAEADRAGRLDGDGIDAWITALDKLGTPTPAVLDALVEAAARSARPVACAAVEALTRVPRWTPGAAGERLAARSRDPAEDPVVRHALRHLLARTGPKLLVGGADAWSRLAEHRERLGAWEWERVVR